MPQVSKKGLPPDVDDLYKGLQQEIIWIHAKWMTYRQLFAVDRERIEILNASAPFFFRVVQETLLEDTLLAISRLTDPPRSMGKDNRSLLLLVERLKDQAPKELRRQIELDMSEITESCSPFRDWRNRRLAHSDLDTSLQVSDDPLPGVSRAHIERALTAVSALMNRISGHFEESETLYSAFRSWSGAERLLDPVQHGLAYEQAERDEIREKLKALKDGSKSA